MSTISFAVYGPEQGYFISFLHDHRTLEYTLGYAGSIAVPGTADTQAVLERIFAEGNGEGTGAGFTVAGRSMSTGDVVHVDGLGVWLCDSVGWSPVSATDEARFPLGVSASVGDERSGEDSRSETPGYAAPLHIAGFDVVFHYETTEYKCFRVGEGGTLVGLFRVTWTGREVFTPHPGARDRAHAIHDAIGDAVAERCFA